MWVLGAHDSKRQDVTSFCERCLLLPLHICTHPPTIAHSLYFAYPSVWKSEGATM